MSAGDLYDLAKVAGLMPDWTDAHGRSQTVRPQTLRAVLHALGLPADSDQDIAQSREYLNERGREPPAMVVVRSSERFSLGGAHKAILHMESGGEMEAPRRTDEKGQAVFESPSQIGYHRIEVDGHLCTLVVTPRRCLTVRDIAPERRLSALAVQLYALRGGHSAGFGDFAALSNIAEQAAQLGIDALAVSPVHALMPGGISPYSPSTRYFYDALYADVALSGGLAASDDGGTMVDWPSAAEQKLSVLRATFQSFKQRPSPPEFRAFCAERGERLLRHARFEALDAYFRKQSLRRWRSWPQSFRDPDSADVAMFAQTNDNDVQFYMFLQWLAAESLSAAQDKARASGMKIGLISDIAVGMDPNGGHAWSAPDEILSGLSVGAPPDVFNTGGQNWGLTALSPSRFRHDGYDSFIETLRASMRYAGGVRIDHAMGLCRLWLIPDGSHAGEGVYLHYPMHDLLGLIALESHRNCAIVIGEDLGTVPEGFRPAAVEAGLIGMEVLWFQREWQAFLAPQRWSKNGAALTTTHDLPTVAGWWEGRDIDWLENLGRRSEHGDAAAERAARRDDRNRLWFAFQQSGSAASGQPSSNEPGSAVEAALDFVGSTPCLLAIVPIDDILEVVEQPNIPGTIDEHPNWRRRLPPDASLSSPKARKNLASLRNARHRT